VTFKDGAATLGVITLDKTGRAALTISTLEAGSHQITASYSGDPTFAASAGAVTQVVAAPVVSTKTSVQASASPSTAGKPVTFVASVTGTSGVPSGDVTFSEGSRTLAFVALDRSGHATFTTSSLGAGNHQITASYGGSTGFARSQGVIGEVVNAVQSPGPRVIQIQRYGYHSMPTVLVLTVDSALDPTSAQNANNYLIIGPSGRLIAVSSAIYDAGARTVTVYPSERLNFHYTYFLQVNGTTATGVHGLNGALLNATGQGLPGHDYGAAINWSILVFAPYPGTPGLSSHG
jgi:hypothetical protein